MWWRKNNNTSGVLHMAIDDKHAQYSAIQSQWVRLRDVSAGSVRVKSKGEKYLPMLTEQSGLEYAAYVMRALFYEAFSRTVVGLSGAVMRKPAKVVVPNTFESYTKDIDLEGATVDQFAYWALIGILTIGRAVAYVDAPPEGAENWRPYSVLLPGESVIDWVYKWVPEQTRHVLQRVVVEEMRPVEEIAENATPDEKLQWRQWELVDGQAVQTITQKSKSDGTESETVVSSKKLTRQKVPLDFIPVYFANPQRNTPDIEAPPLPGLAELVLSHYRNSADLEHGLHFCGLPTPVAVGFPVDQDLKIGSMVAWVSDNSDASAQMLEFKGDGLGALERAMAAKQILMATLGARLLESQKAGVEAARTVELRQAGEAATLVGIAQSSQVLVQSCLDTMVWWGGGEMGQATVEINKDVSAVFATPGQMAELLKAVQGGTMSFATYYYNLEKLEMSRPNVDWEQEQKDIDNDNQADGGLGGTGAGEISPEDQAAIKAQINAVV